MCFHTSQTKKVVELENRYKVTLSDDEARDAYDIPRYHINGFSHPDMLIIPQEKSTVLANAFWGIVPGNKSTEQISDYYKESVQFGGGLNAQSEKLFNHFIYKNSAFTRRCIIPVTGFFEPHEYKSKKYPFHIKSKNEDVLSLAGLYTLVEDVVTFTILTKQASPLFAKIHNKKNRQPVILHKDFEKDWLKNDLNQNGIMELINLNFNEEDLSAYSVSKELFSPNINSDTPSIINKVEYEGVFI